METIKISIITTCYNRVATIGDAIRSVLEQDYPDIEYIIVDGASTDGSIDVIKNTIAGHEDWVKFISEPDNGMYEAINKGIRMATGDYIGLVHSDDVLFTSHTISAIVAELKRTDADFLYADGLFVDENNTNKVVRKWIGGSYRLWKVKRGWLPLHTTCYIGRDAMRRRGLYNETYKIAADSDLLFRYLLGGNMTIVYLKKYVVRMRMGGMSTDSRRRKLMWHEDIRMYNSHGMNPVITKIEKMLWKLPQFIWAKFMRNKSDLMKINK